MDLQACVYRKQCISMSPMKEFKSLSADPPFPIASQHLFRKMLRIALKVLFKHRSSNSYIESCIIITSTMFDLYFQDMISFYGFFK